MIKSLLLVGLVAAATTSVVRVSMSASGVEFGRDTVSSSVLQLRETDGGHVLASKDVVESLGGTIEIRVEGGVVSIDPGVRLTRTASGFDISSHGRRPVVLMTEDSQSQVASPVSVALVDGEWVVNGGDHLKGSSLRAKLSQEVDATRVASIDNPGCTPGTPGAPPAGGSSNPKMDLRRVLWIDPYPSAEPADEQSVKSIPDVSPSGLR